MLRIQKRLVFCIKAVGSCTFTATVCLIILVMRMLSSFTTTSTRGEMPFLGTCWS